MSFIEKEIRTIQRLLFHAQSEVGTTFYCEKEGCQNSTRDNKHYCTEHVEENPYAKQVVARILQNELELKEASGDGPVTEYLELEFKAVMRDHGWCATVPRLCAELGWCVKLVKKVAHHFEESGHLKMTKGERETLICSWPGEL